MPERERNLTEWEESVIRLVHHEFKAMTQAEAAKVLGVSASEVSRTVRGIIEKAKTCKPIQVLLPILTKHQFEIYNRIVGRGLTAGETAKELGLASAGTVNTIVATLRTKGMNILRQKDKSKPISYTASMDKDVKHRF